MERSANAPKRSMERNTKRRDLVVHLARALVQVQAQALHKVFMKIRMKISQFLILFIRFIFAFHWHLKFSTK